MRLVNLGFHTARVTQVPVGTKSAEWLRFAVAAKNMLKYSHQKSCNRKVLLGIHTLISLSLSMRLPREYTCSFFLSCRNVTTVQCPSI